MADKEFESEDPMQLVGTLMNCTDEEIEEMGLTFIEEYARMQWTSEDILAVFTDPQFRGPHTVYQAKGRAFVEALIGCVLQAPQSGTGLAPGGRE